jgi:hypothetical protein
MIFQIWNPTAAVYNNSRVDVVIGHLSYRQRMNHLLIMLHTDFPLDFPFRFIPFALSCVLSLSLTCCVSAIAADSRLHYSIDSYFIIALYLFKLQQDLKTNEEPIKIESS